MIQDQDQDQYFHFVLEAPRDQDPGLEDYITVQQYAKNGFQTIKFLPSIRTQH